MVDAQVLLSQEFSWQGRTIRWDSYGSGPPVVFCHGTPWSSYVWSDFAVALSQNFTVYLWDMPGYGQSSKDPAHSVSLGVQGELFSDLLRHWELETPHVIAHDYGGAVALRAHLLGGSAFASLALVDVVALAPWGSSFFQLVRESSSVFTKLAAHIHASVVESYIESAAHGDLPDHHRRALCAPWLGEEAQHAFYQQIAEADQRFTDDIEPQYGDIEIPVHIVWGEADPWIPVDRAHRLAETIPGSTLAIIAEAGHLIQLEAPVSLAMTLREWLTQVSGH